MAPNPRGKAPDFAAWNERLCARTGRTHTGPRAERICRERASRYVYICDDGSVGDHTATAAKTKPATAVPHRTRAFADVNGHANTAPATCLLYTSPSPRDS